jgi:hypothetical protein
MDFDPRVIIPAHCGEATLQKLEQARQRAADSFTAPVEWSLRYLDIYEEAYETAKTGAELVDLIFRQYPDVTTVDFVVHWQARLLFPRSCPDWLTPLPGEPGEIFLNPDGGFDGDPPKE